MGFLNTGLCICSVSLWSHPSGGSGSRNITPSPQVTTETDIITDYVISQTSKIWISFLLIDKTKGVWCVCMEQTQLI